MEYVLGDEIRRHVSTTWNGLLCGFALLRFTPVRTWVLWSTCSTAATTKVQKINFMKCCAICMVHLLGLRLAKHASLVY